MVTHLMAEDIYVSCKILMLQITQTIYSSIDNTILYINAKTILIKNSSSPKSFGISLSQGAKQLKFSKTHSSVTTTKVHIL